MDAKRRAMPENFSSASEAVFKSTPHSSAAATAAVALATLCRPGILRRNFCPLMTKSDPKPSCAYIFGVNVPVMQAEGFGVRGHGF